MFTCRHLDAWAHSLGQLQHIALVWARVAKPVGTGPFVFENRVVIQVPPPAPVVPATVLGRLAWHYLINGGWQQVADEYVFDTRILTNHQPYFAAYIKVGDLLKFTDRLELVQDEWGYLLLWATLGIATVFALTLVLLPVIFGWRTIFSRYPGKAGTMLYFLCLGLGYNFLKYRI